MANTAKASVNRKQLVVELTASDPILKRVAEQTLREAFFDPAVDQMQQDFAIHPVTNEIAGGVGSSNVSDTLEGSFRDESGDVPPNLWGFIGFDRTEISPEDALEPISSRLDPSHPDGPKMTYIGRERDQLTYRFKISAPNESAIYSDERTSIPWLSGISWVKRIEQGIPGITHFLNVNRPSSRSGGGIQVKGQVRTGRFRPVSYLSRIFNNFLRRVAGRSDTGRSV